MESLPPLPRRRLGPDGPEVSAIGLGTMAFASPSAEPEECVALLHEALDRGIDLVDTADAYGDGAAEELVGRALAGRRDEVVLATKVGLPMQTPVAGSGCRRTGSPRRASRASGASAPTTSTSTSCIARTPRPRSRRPSRPSGR